MTSFMTFSVYSLRVSSEIPVESDFLPMVTLYFILGITYTFVSFNWFILANELAQKKDWPKFLKQLASGIKRILFWKYGDTPFWSSKVVPTTTKVKELMRTNQAKVEMSNVEKQEGANNNKKSDSSKVPLEVPGKLLNVKLSCNNCDHCVACTEDKEKEKNKKIKKELIDSYVSALNHLVFFLMLLVVVACNLVTWLMIAYPPQ